jgi:hypothetical protein
MFFILGVLVLVRLLGLYAEDLEDLSVVLGDIWGSSSCRGLVLLLFLLR